MERILNKETLQDRNRQLLTILFRRGGKAVPCLIDGLRFLNCNSKRKNIRIIMLLDCNSYKSNSVMVEYLFCTNNYNYGITIENTFNNVENHKFYRFQVSIFQ